MLLINYIHIFKLMENDKILDYLKSRKNNLEDVLKDEAKTQKELIKIEKEEEEQQNIESIQKYSVKELESLGICIRKLQILEVTYESYGKTHVIFKRLIEIQTKISTGDILGLFAYSDKLESKPFSTGIVYRISDVEIEIAFDDDFNEETISGNLALVLLVNYVTFEKINKVIDKFEKYDVKDHSHALLNVLFNCRMPTFKTNSEYYNANQYDENFKIDNFSFFNDNLNDSQKEAIRFSIAANELALIHGPPGTGKTTTVCEFVLQSVKMGLKILVVCPSNLAVDNIAEKLQNYDINITRIGHPARLTNKVLKISMDMKISESAEMKDCKDINRQILKKNKEIHQLEKKIRQKKDKNENYDKINDLKYEINSLRKSTKNSYKTAFNNVVNKSNVVLATIIGSGDNNLYKCISKWSEQCFDVVVIDECGQSIEAACWIPLLLAKKAVLAGDHLQLPPTIKSKKLEKSLGFTLFDRMILSYEDVCCKLLSVQYRMNDTIMGFSNNELYKNKLISDISVANSTIKDLINKEISIDEMDILEYTNDKIIFFNTENYDFFESKDEASLSYYNFGECLIVKHFCDYFKNNFNLSKNEIGVISPYSAQVDQIKNLELNIEVSTVDGFQGREKEIIIISLVRSNNSKEIGFLKDKRRLNVALTRAKKLLVIICDGRMLRNKQSKKNIDKIESQDEESDFLNNLYNYLIKNAREICILETIFNNDDIENIKNKSGKNIDNCYVKSIENSEIKKGEKVNKKDKNKNKQKNENDIKQGNDEVTNLSNCNKNILKEKDVLYDISGKNLEDEIKEKHKKLLLKFIESSLKEYKIDNLSSNERRLMHEVAEELGLIHKSEGNDKNRILVIRKKDNNNLNNCTVDNHNNDKILINYKEENKSHLNDKKISDNKENLQSNKLSNNKKNKSDKNDDIDDILKDICLNEIKTCSFYMCKTDNTNICIDCNKIYCKNHFDKEKHGCEYEYDEIKDNNLNTAMNKQLKDKIRKEKIELEKKRTKKPDKTNRKGGK